MRAKFWVSSVVAVGVLFPCLLFAQTSKLSGKVTDEKALPVPYAAIGFKYSQKGVAADEAGVFTLSYNENDLPDSLLISAIGHETKTIAFSELLLQPVIVLTIKSWEFKPIIVTSKDAEALVKKAVEKIPDNYPQTPYFIPAFFRQFHRENGKAARLIEAAMTVYDPGYINPQSLTLKEQFDFKALRRSKVFEKNGFEHDDHLVDLFKQNLVHYPCETILNSSAAEFFHFEKNETKHTDTSTCVKFFYQNPSDPKIRWGNLYIADKDFAILRLEENTMRNEDYNPRLKASNNSEWKFFEGEMVISYKQDSGKYFLDSISFFYRHTIVSKVFSTTDFTVDEYFNLWTGKPDRDSVPQHNPGKNFQNTGGLYSKKYKYDAELWKNYLPAMLHPLNPAIAAELGKNNPLEEQFEKNGTD